MLEYDSFKEFNLKGRYVNNSHIIPLENKHRSVAEISKIGNSVKGRAIYSYKFGIGKKRVLVWSQMHGNESTTTKALFDFFNRLHYCDKTISLLLSECTFYIIPILNPDGAYRYTRLNANSVDLNRDAQILSQPESKLLKNVFNSFQPHYCFNLHGQRTIFSAGFSANSSVLSFLSPAQDEQRSVSETRKIAMKVILAAKNSLEDLLGDNISRYDDGFNINCVGDSFQSLNTPTILFEAGHFPNDYNRDKTRFFVYKSLIASFIYIAKNDINSDNYQAYFDLPENQKLFFDIIIRNVSFCDGDIVDLAIQYEEVLIDKKLKFIPKVSMLGSLEEYFGHKEFDGGQNSILINNSSKRVVLLTIIDKISINGIDFSDKISVY
jgi:hypothetical protein